MTERASVAGAKTLFTTGHFADSGGRLVISAIRLRLGGQCGSHAILGTILFRPAKRWMD